MTDKKNTLVKDDADIVNSIGKIISVDIVPEMEKSYLDYAMSVIVSRALPDVRDGLKPVHRRIIYAMNKMGLAPTGKNVKSAAVVGDVLKSYHPHGDAAVYMSLVRMAQDFSLRYPLVKGQGNFGSIDGDPPAAMRYTEVKMSKFTPEMVADIDKDTVPMVDNYDATLKEPDVLPSRLPNLLLNGADGIAVGMATKIPPHNLKEICQGIGYILEHCKLEREPLSSAPTQATVNPSTRDQILEPIYQLEQLKFNLETAASVEELIKFIPGPDFPTAGEIYGRQGIVDMYQTGRGKFILRGKTNIEETKSGKIRIIITQLPYQVNKAEFVQKIAQLHRDKKIIGISDLRDESDRHGIRVVVEIKKLGKPKSILNRLFKYTPLQSSYSANLLALVNGIPQTLNLRQLLLLFIRHRESIIRKRSLFDLKNAFIRAHILQGLKIALDAIDEIIKTIRASKNSDDAKANLIARFKFTDLQASAILEMQLRRLAALERQKLEEEYAQVNKIIDELTGIVKEPQKMITTLKSENEEIEKNFSDTRLTKIFVRGLEELSDEDLIPNEPTLVIITKTGYVKRLSKESYHSQNRGGVGVSGMTTKSEDEVDRVMSVNTHDELLFFTNRGRVFKTRVWDINESSRQSKGQAVINLINIVQGETVEAVVALSKNNPAKYILLATKNGIVKKTSIERFKNIRQNGLAAIKLDQNDQLAWALTTNGSDQIFLVTSQGKSICFSENDCRPMGRQTRGVRGISLKPNDFLVGADILPPKSDNKADFRHLFVITQNGVGKRTDAYLYPTQKRGGVGVKVSNISSKTGQITTAHVITPADNQMVIISKKALTIKIFTKDIPILNRNTRGVILMRFKTADDKVSAITVLQNQ